jgi:hypothetical protein
VDDFLATRYAQQLLVDLGLDPCSVSLPAFDHPADSWTRSGLAHLTGDALGPPLMSPSGLSAAADGALGALQALASPVEPAGSRGSALAGLRGSAFAGLRGRTAGLTRSGAASAGQTCRLLPSLDGVLAVSLARPTDWECVEAWLECELPDNDWAAVARAVHCRLTQDCLERGRLLGLAVADASRPPSFDGRWYHTVCTGPGRSGARGPARGDGATPMVIDLSALWAGPLCTDLLGRIGARVIKVEDARRLDGTRRGNPGLYECLNGAKHSVVLDFSCAQDRQTLLRLIGAADIVVESARPRALQQLGIHAEQLVRQHQGLTWISITAYGRGELEANWIGYGDDVGVAAGLANLMHAVYGKWWFCGDAIADPLTGLHAALLAWASWLKGVSVLQSISLRGVAAAAVAGDGQLDPEQRRARTRCWAERARQSVRAPQLYALPRSRGPILPPGASNATVLQGLLPC